MAYFQQLELFDLQAYTVQQPTALNLSKVKVQEKYQNADYQQLELQLTLRRANEASLQILKQAA